MPSTDGSPSETCTPVISLSPSFLPKPPLDAPSEPWFVNVIEPNLAGATAIADHWYELLSAA